ncbi:MAG: penicillin-binding protein 1B [Gammaproteobacteria bacterium]|nr:penicillin-binding protein 1B [Gammaproteobacteria bacterium]
MRKHSGSKIGRWARYLRISIRVVGFGFVATVLMVSGYLVYLDQTITATFEGRRWSVPAKVYGAPLELYAGLDVDPAELSLELARLGYRQNPDIDRSGLPGSYRLHGNELVVILRPFIFLDAHRPTTRATIHLRDGAITSLWVAREPVAVVRVEPPLIGSFFASHGEDRLIVSPQETPQLLLETLIAVEDRNFERHLGFDPVGIARAFWVNLREGEVRQGGSTLTQQLVKSYFLDNRRTLARKLREVAMAVILDARFDKQDLLNAYVNEIYLGQDGSRAIHGFGLGAQFYFNKPLAELDAEQIALLVAVIRGPSYYNPFKHPSRARARRDFVLNTMLKFELIDRDTFTAAVAGPVRRVQNARRGGSYYPAFMDLVRQQLARDYDGEDLSANGYRIFTTLNPRIQDAAQDAVTSTLLSIEEERSFPQDYLNAAFVVRGSQTGDVKALVGGRRAGFQGFNRALSARRQVGSLIKPVVYLTAIETGRYHLASSVDDSPLVLHDYGDWQPTNFDGKYRGKVPLVRALGDSLNVATVRLGMEVGVENIATRIAELTDIEKPVPYPAILLGSMDLTPLEISDLYAIFAGGGFVTPARAIIAVLDEQGRTLSRYPIDVKQAVAPEHAGAVTRALQVVMQRGTGRSSIHSKRGVAGKTGTSDDYRDSWFAGYDGDLLSVVWVGRDDNSPHGLTGSVGAMRVWDAFASTVPVTPSVSPFVGTDYSWVDVDYASGTSARASCADVVSLPIPTSVSLPRKPGCGDTLKRLGDRVRSWFKDS